jgi:hypothetical protein
LGYIKDSDVDAVTQMPDVEGDAEEELEEGCNRILI